MKNRGENTAPDHSKTAMSDIGHNKPETTIHILREKKKLSRKVVKLPRKEAEFPSPEGFKNTCRCGTLGRGLGWDLAVPG